MGIETVGEKNMEEAFVFALEECSIKCNKTNKLQKINLIKQLRKLLTTLSRKKHGVNKKEKRVEYPGVNFETFHPMDLHFLGGYSNNYMYGYHHRTNESNIEYKLYLKREWGIK